MICSSGRSTTSMGMSLECPRNEMGSDPRFGSGVGFEAFRPLFYWGSPQTETKRVFSGLSLGKPRASPPRIRLQTGRTRSISMGYMYHEIEQRQFFQETGHHSRPANPFKPTGRSQPHDDHLIVFIASPAMGVTACGVSPKNVSSARNGLTAWWHNMATQRLTFSTEACSP